MKNGTIFWGSFLITLGFCLLALQQHWLLMPWDILHQYWAIVLILWGVAIIVRKTAMRWVVVMLSALLAGVVVASAMSAAFDDDFHGCGWRVHIGDHRHHHWDNEDAIRDEDDEDEQDNAVNSDSTQSRAKDSLQLKKMDSIRKNTPLY